MFFDVLQLAISVAKISVKRRVGPLIVVISYLMNAQREKCPINYNSITEKQCDTKQPILFTFYKFDLFLKKLMGLMKKYIPIAGSMIF